MYPKGGKVYAKEKRLKFEQLHTVTVMLTDCCSLRANIVKNQGMAYN